MVSALGFVERRKNNLRFESHLLEVMSDAVIVTDRELRVTTWNAAAERIYGWTREEAFGQALDQLLHSEFLDTTREAAQEELRLKKTWSGVLRQHHKSGQVRFVLASISLLEEDGCGVGEVTIHRDITRVRKVEEAIRHAANLGDRVDDAAFYAELVRQVADSLTVGWALLGEEDPENPGFIHTLAVWSQGALRENFTYSLDGAPCGEVKDGAILNIPQGVAARFPRDLMLAELGIDSYLGAALLDSKGRRSGILVVMDHRPMGDPAWMGSILKIYADRASAELERRKALHALEISEARLNDALEGANEGVWDWNASTDRVYFSPRWKEMLGYLPEEVGDTFQEWSTRVHPEDLEACLEALDDHFQGVTRSYQREHRLRCKDGTYKWILARGKVFQWGPDGKPARLVGTHQDITERKRNEAALQTSEERLELALQATQDGVWDVDLVARTFFGSPQWWALIGLQAQGAPQDPWAWRSLVHPEDLARVDQELAGALEGSATTLALSIRLRHRDGHYLPVLTRATIRRDGQGRAIRISGTQTDQTRIQEVITRKEVERASLELIARGAPLLEILEELVAGIEKAYPGTLGSVLLVDANGKQLGPGVGPSLPKPFARWLDAIEMGPGQGSFGAAAHTGQRALVADIATDPLWSGIKELTLAQGLASCWSLPLFSPAGAVLGTLSMYHRAPRTPDAEVLEYLERCAHLASVAIQRERDTAKVREANNLLERTGQIAQVGGWQLEVASGALDWSAEVFRIHDLEAARPPTLEEAIRFIHPEFRAHFAGAVEGCLSVGRPWDLELPMTTAKGRSLWIHTQGHAEQEGGRTVRIFGAIQDITQRTKAERALEASETLHRTLVETLSEGVMVYDGQGVCITANEQACRILGTSREELVFKSSREPLPFRFQSPDGAFLEGDELPMRACRLHGRATQDQLLRLVRPGGSSAWLLLNVRPLGHGTSLGYWRVVMSFSDITANHEAEQGRLESLQRLQELRAAIDQANIYALTDVEGRILDVNEEFIRISGYNRGELIGANHRILKSGTHSDAFYRDLWRTIASGKIWRGEIHNRAKNGRLYWVSTTIVPLRHLDGRPKGYMVFRQEATEQHELQEALLQSQKLESVGTLVAGIAHDFNNILMSIGGFAEVLSASPGLTAKQVKGLDVIGRAGERGRGLVSKLLNFSRKSAPQKTQVNLNAVVHETAQLFKRGLTERIRLTLLLAPELPSTLADPDQMHQVLMNLCVNAKDAILGEGELSLSTGLETLSLEQAAKLSLPEGAYVFAAISDTGQGIPTMVFSRMFEPFYTTKGVGKGTGLGLSVVHGIVRGHGGAIRVESELGVGSTFKVYLPLLKAAEDMTLEPVGPGARGRLMLVTSGQEVDPGMGSLLEALRFELFPMDLQQNWGSRIEWSDAVLLFLATEADWATAGVMLRQGPKDVPIIVLTSTEDAVFRVPSLHHPISAVLASPPRRGELVDTLNALIPPLDGR